MSFESEPMPPVTADVVIDSSHLPTTTNEKGEQVLSMYWLDAYEDPFTQPGLYAEVINTSIVDR